MLGFADTITVYNAVPDTKTGGNTYHRTVIQGCSWFGKRRANPKNGGLADDKEFMVRILPGVSQSTKGYVSPIAYANPETQYTFDEKTIVVKGEGPPAPTNAQERGSLIPNSNEAFTVLDVHDNRRAGLLRHIYVEGK